MLQAVGAAVYLAADGLAPVVTAAVLFAAGQHAFYSALIADVAGDGPKDRAFTVANLVRGATFGFGSLVVAGLLTGAGPIGYRMAIGVDAVSLLLAAALLAFWLRVPPPAPAAPPAPAVPERGVLRDRPYLGPIAITTMFALASDFFLVGLPVYALEILHAPPWLLVAAAALLSAGLLRWVAPRLPAHAVMTPA